MPYLTRVQIDGLLGEYRHDISFPQEWNFVILYGPNGVGKTKLLEAIDALIKLDFARLITLPFGRLVVTFSDGVDLIAEKESQPGTLDLEIGQEIFIDRNEQIESTLVLSIRKNGNLYASPDMADVENFETWAEENSPYVQIGPRTWEDTTDGEVVSTTVLRQRLNQSYRSHVNRYSQKVPTAMREYCTELRSHLIETQRLLFSHSSSNRSMANSRRRISTLGRPEPIELESSTVSQFSADLKRRLAAALAENSRTTQQLDRTFPKRVLEHYNPRHVDDSMVRNKYAQQSQLRNRLSAISLIGGEADLPLPERDLADWERHVLWTSLIDTDEKLSSFDEILDKITLLEQIINRRFFGKQIRVSAEDGLSIRSLKSGQFLAPEALSSGEQHELIMVYDLLFNVPAGATVLIDEPEISLHVVWQQRFLEDISNIARLSSIRFILATHSPQIIHKSWSRTVRLGPEEEGEQ